MSGKFLATMVVALLTAVSGCAMCESSTDCGNDYDGGIHGGHDLNWGRANSAYAGDTVMDEGQPEPEYYTPAAPPSRRGTPTLSASRRSSANVNWAFDNQTYYQPRRSTR